jgi:hypothetical protein
MAFSAQIDPSNIQIPVSSDMKSLDGDPISAGIVWRNSEVRDSISVYPTFLSQLVSKEDEIVITAEGLLQYDAASNEYQISSEDKLANRGERGNYIALNTKTCSMEGDGVISLGMQFGTPEMKSVGKVNYDQEKGETTFNITTTFDIPLNKGLMQSLGDRISNIEGLKGPRDLRGVTIEQALLEWDGLKAADDFKTEYIYGGKVKKIPESINNSMTITGLKLKAYEKKGSEKGLITTVDNATLVNFYGEPVMKTIPIKAFFIQNYTPTKKKNDVEDGDEFIMKMAVPGGADYWFYYTNEKNDGQLELITNDEDFNADVDGIKEDKRKAKNFIYKTSTQSTPQIIFSRVFK